MINMAVAVELLPVTGQTLPLISSGGSSIWMTCFALGVILSVTKKEEEIAQELKEKQIREEALQKLIDAQLESDAQEKEEEYSIEDHANPMNAVLNR
jgi:cell division protein FtsW